MEESAYQALYTGVYVFVFIIALSATIYLFTSIMNYADLAYEYGKTVVNGNIIENISDSKYRILTGSDVITYYFNYVEKDKFENGENVNNQYNITFLNLDGNKMITGSNLSYSDLKAKINYNDEYKITYNSIDSNGVINLTIQKNTD